MTPKAATGTLATALQLERSKRGINQTEAAKLIGVERSVFSHWISLRGSMPGLQNVPGIAKFLGVTESEVLAMFPASHRLRAARGATLKTMQAMLDDVRDLRAEVALLRADIAAITGAATNGKATAKRVG